MFSSMGSRAGFVVLSGLFAVACAGADGASGSEGSSALMQVVPEPAGANCANGGQAMTYGVDHDDDGKLDESEVDGTSFVCNGPQGQAGADGEAAAKGDKGDKGDTGAQGLTGLPGQAGPQGVDGKDGVNGKDGANGKDAPVVLLNQFLASQVAAGMLVTCASTNQTAATVECRGMKVNGLDIYLGPKEANAICAGITGKGYDTASGLGVVPAPWMSLNSTGQWTVASAGSTSPMQNLSCKR